MYFAAMFVIRNASPLRIRPRQHVRMGTRDGEHFAIEPRHMTADILKRLRAKNDGAIRYSDNA